MICRDINLDHRAGKDPRNALQAAERDKLVSDVAVCETGNKLERGVGYVCYCAELGEGGLYRFARAASRVPGAMALELGWE